MHDLYVHDHEYTVVHPVCDGACITIFPPPSLTLFSLPSLSLSLLIRQCYGEGLQWAGCVIMTLLSQEKRFASLDFSYHLLRIHEFDGQEGVVQNHVSEEEREGGREREVEENMCREKNEVEISFLSLPPSLYSLGS